MKNDVMIERPQAPLPQAHQTAQASRDGALAMLQVMAGFFRGAGRYLLEGRAA